MDLRRYLYFLAVADTGSFARAAEQLGIKQPPLSQSIARLERDIGVTLFRRTTRRVELTEAGKAFLPEARVAVTAVRRSEELARAAVTGDRTIRIGVTTPALFGPLASLLRAARALELPTRIAHLGTEEQLVALAAGEIHMGLATPPFRASRRLQVHDVSNEAVVAALPEDEFQSTLRAVELSAIHDRLLLFPRSAGPALWDATISMFRAVKLEPRVVAECPASMAATLAMVAAGIGATIAPADFARNVRVTGVIFRPFQRTVRVPTWPIALVHMPLSANAPPALVLSKWHATPWPVRSSRTIRRSR